MNHHNFQKSRITDAHGTCKRYVASIWLGIAIGACALGACSTPYNSARFQPTMTPQQLAASEAYIEGVENKARRHAHEDRMSRAQAEELATRNAPTHVSTSTTTVFPFFW